MTKSFIALITPMGGGERPDQGLPGKPPGRPDQGLPGSQPGIDNSLPGGINRPEHPIYFPLPPGGSLPHPDQGLPGEQPGIDNSLPGSQPRPEHPIVLPPDGGGGWLPIYIWGPNDPRPGTGLPGEQPGIDNSLPGSQPRPDNTLPPIEIAEIPDLPGNAQVVAGWTPDTGWVSVVIITPDNPVPTPSKRK